MKEKEDINIFHICTQDMRWNSYGDFYEGLICDDIKAPTRGKARARFTKENGLEFTEPLSISKMRNHKCHNCNEMVFCSLDSARQELVWCGTCDDKLAVEVWRKKQGWE